MASGSQILSRDTIQMGTHQCLEWPTLRVEKIADNKGEQNQGFRSNSIRIKELPPSSPESE